MSENDVLIDLCDENADVSWCGPGGLFERAADDIATLRSILRRASLKGFDTVADEVKTYLEQHPI